MTRTFRTLLASALLAAAVPTVSPKTPNLPANPPKRRKAPANRHNNPSRKATISP